MATRAIKLSVKVSSPEFGDKRPAIKNGVSSELNRSFNCVGQRASLAHQETLGTEALDDVRYDLTCHFVPRERMHP
jgi:hypothetical protein